MRLTFCERSDTKCLVELIPTKEGSNKIRKVHKVHKVRKVYKVHKVNETDIL